MCLELMRGMMRGVHICCFIEGYDLLDWGWDWVVAVIRI